MILEQQQQEEEGNKHSADLFETNKARRGSLNL